MKTKILIQIIVLFITQFVISQINPISIEQLKNHKFYHTFSKNKYQLLYENQSNELFTKIRNNIELTGNINLDSIQLCFSDERLNVVTQIQPILLFEFYIDQSGKVKACSLKNYYNKVDFNNEEIECILSKAMQVHIGLNVKDNNPFNFYMKVLKRYRFNNSGILENPHPDPDLPEDQH